ncbi:MAG TPA: IPT/TIG domain-containing protein [Blastocatellia bacterium]|nr:IPT/TIG domain-containing protein [Blastocatellia bacterium]
MRKVVARLLAVILSLSPAALMIQWGPAAVIAQQKPPELDKLFPSTMPAGTDTFTIRLEGRRFADDARVVLDGVELGSSRVTSKGKVLLAEVAREVVASPGTHAVHALNPDGMTTSTLTLTVVAKDPDLNMRLQGNALQEDLATDFEVRLIGDGFKKSSKGLLWGKGSPTTTFISEDELALEIPQSFTTDPARIPVFVRNKGGKFSNADIFFVIPAPALLSEVNPNSLEVGTEDEDITVFGENFKPSAKVVAQPIDGDVIELEITKQREGKIEAVLPAALRSEPGQVAIRVEQDGIQSADAIIDVSPTEDPFIFTISPARFRQKEGKETLTIIGTNFRGKIRALIDGQEANIKDENPRRLTVSISKELLSTPGMHMVQVVEEKDGAVSNVAEFEVAADVTVSTLSGTRDGFNPEPCAAADDVRFRRPRRISFGPDGLLYLTDQQNHVIRTVDTTTGEVCTIAGTGEMGYNDSGNAAGYEPSFSFPNGIAVAADGTILVSENGNNVIRRLVRGAGGAVTIDTFAGTTHPITNPARQERLKSTLEGIDGFRDGESMSAAFRLPDDMVVASDGSIYACDPNNHAIRRIRSVDGRLMVETIAGTGVPGFADGEARNARFNTPTGLALSPDESILYVADTFNHRVRQLDLVTLQVRSVAGSGAAVSDDGPRSLASFNRPVGVAVDSDGTIYVSEFTGSLIRRVDTAGNVSTLAGTGGVRFHDGPGVRATFRNPIGLAIDRARGLLFVCDYENFLVRKIALR